MLHWLYLFVFYLFSQDILLTGLLCTCHFRQCCVVCQSRKICVKRFLNVKRVILNVFIYRICRMLSKPLPQVSLLTVANKSITHISTCPHISFPCNSFLFVLDLPHSEQITVLRSSDLWDGFTQTKEVLRLF